MWEDTLYNYFSEFIKILIGAIYYIIELIFAGLYQIVYSIVLIFVNLFLAIYNLFASIYNFVLSFVNVFPHPISDILILGFIIILGIQLYQIIRGRFY